MYIVSQIEYNQGALYHYEKDSMVSQGSWADTFTIGFDSNRLENNTGNPMAGHAIADDTNGGIRPYNISMIPIIIVS